MYKPGNKYGVIFLIELIIELIIISLLNYFLNDGGMRETRVNCKLLKALLLLCSGCQWENIVFSVDGENGGEVSGWGGGSPSLHHVHTPAFLACWNVFLAFYFFPLAIMEKLNYTLKLEQMYQLKFWYYNWLISVLPFSSLFLWFYLFMFSMMCWYCPSSQYIIIA